MLAEVETGADGVAAGVGLADELEDGLEDGTADAAAEGVAAGTGSAAGFWAVAAGSVTSALSLPRATSRTVRNGVGAHRFAVLRFPSLTQSAGTVASCNRPA